MNEISIIDRKNITLPQAREIARLNRDAWPPENAASLAEDAERVLGSFKEPDGPMEQRHRVFCVAEGDNILAKASVFPRLIELPGGRLKIMALASVCADKAHRGRGLGAAVVRGAFEQVDRGHFPLALFQTTTPVRPFYEKLGARAISNRFINSRADDPEANPWWDPEIMLYPADYDWPEGTVDLLGKGY
ncbi:MAG: GNAT family N-acetyltransferase [Candidatus Sumerlaeota bacterium]